MNRDVLTRMTSGIMLNRNLWEPSQDLGYTNRTNDVVFICMLQQPLEAVTILPGSSLIKFDILGRFELRRAEDAHKVHCFSYHNLAESESTRFVRAASARYVNPV